MFFVYLICSKPLGTLCVGVTPDLPKRIWQHKNKVVAGFIAEIFYNPEELTGGSRLSPGRQ